MSDTNHVIGTPVFRQKLGPCFRLKNKLTNCYRLRHWDRSIYQKTDNIFTRSASVRYPKSVVGCRSGKSVYDPTSGNFGWRLFWNDFSINKIRNISSAPDLNFWYRGSIFEPVFLANLTPYCLAFSSSILHAGFRGSREKQHRFDRLITLAFIAR